MEVQHGGSKARDKFSVYQNPSLTRALASSSVRPSLPVLLLLALSPITSASSILVLSSSDKDLAHIGKHLEAFNEKGGDVKWHIHDERSLLALQGPLAAPTLQLLTKEDLSKLYFSDFKMIDINGYACYLTRTGYTGEDGIEISVPLENAVDLAKALLEKSEGKVRMTGSGARGSLRLEAGLGLYGNDMEQHITPVEAGLSWAIGKRRKAEGGFLGADVILKQLQEGPKIRRIGLISQGPPPRSHSEIVSNSGENIGEVTSGGFSPCLKKNIAMGYVKSGLHKAGTPSVFSIHEHGVTHVLATSGTGYIGQLKDSFRVTIVDNLSRGNMGAIKVLQNLFPEPGRLQFLYADLGDPKAVNRIFAENAFDAIMHFTAVTYVGENTLEPLRYYHNITSNTLVALEAMAAHNWKTLIYSSTCATCGEPEKMPVTEETPQFPINPYGRLGENIVSIGKGSELKPQRAVLGCENTETGELFSQHADEIMGLGHVLAFRLVEAMLGLVALFTLPAFFRALMLYNGRRALAKEDKAVLSERQLGLLGLKMTGSGAASKTATPPATITSFGVASPVSVTTSTTPSGAARSTPLRPVRMSPGSHQKYSTPPKKGEGELPSPMSLEQAIEQWQDSLRQWFSSVLINPLVQKNQNKPYSVATGQSSPFFTLIFPMLQVKQTTASVGASVTVSQVGSDLSSTTASVDLSPLGGTKDWQPTVTVDEDGVLNQLRAALLHSRDDPIAQTFGSQQQPRQNPLLPAFQACIDAITEHQRLNTLMKGELIKGLLPLSSVRADYIVQRVQELAEGTCLKNYDYTGHGDGHAKLEKKWTSELPTDSYFLLCLFAAFLEHPKWILHVDPTSYSGAQSSKNPLFLGVLPPKERFPEKYVALISGVPAVIHPGALILAVGKQNPPIFDLFWDKKLQTALWDAILLLCHQINVGYDGVVRGIHIGSSALNILSPARSVESMWERSLANRKARPVVGAAGSKIFKPTLTTATSQLPHSRFTTPLHSNPTHWSVSTHFLPVKRPDCSSRLPRSLLLFVVAMDPHPTPFPGKRQSAAAPAKTSVPKPKSIASARPKTARKSSPAPPQPRPRRAFGTVRSSNAHAEKPTPLQKAPKVSPPPALKPSKVSPPPLPKPSKQSPPNLVKATKPSRQAVKVPKKAAPGPEPQPKARKKSQRVSFQEDAATAVAPASGEKAKVSTEDAAGHTPMVSVKALAKKVKVVTAETPFFSAQNCSNCSLDPLEESTYWLTHIHLAESVGKHKVAAAFFHLAFECQAQPIHRIQSELRNYTVRHESAGTLAPLFDELLLAHVKPVSQPKFDTDGFEMVATPLNINVDDNRLDTTTVQMDEKCLECDCSGDAVDVAGTNVVNPLDEGVDQPSFERKLGDSFEFDGCEAVIMDKLVEGHCDLEKSVDVNGSCGSETVQSACRSSVDKLSQKGSPAVTRSSQRQLSSDSPSDKLSLSAGSMSAKRLSSVTPFDNKKSPFGSSSSKRLTSSCPSCKKSLSGRALSSKRMSPGDNPDGEHDITAQAVDLIKVMIPDAECDCPALVDQLKLNEHGGDGAVNEIN
ncbi:hypothetical protein ABZP36_005956 [Zizania latifolia]